MVALASCGKTESPVIEVVDTDRGYADQIVASLSFDEYKEQIRSLANFGNRRSGSPSNIAAGEWLEQKLEDLGYDVEIHQFVSFGNPHSIYVTKVGTEFPDRMYIVSAHFDGFGDGDGADDDASGVSLVLSAARAFAEARVQTKISVRFIFWNTEESGLAGSRAYVSDRAELQGMEDPPGSGLYPEPTWLGMIQHDMLLFDHGLPTQDEQVATADLDIQYSSNSTFAEQSRSLAQKLVLSNVKHSSDYPAELGDGMRGTDSVSFRNETASISVRENMRRELEQGANPNWHARTDIFETYSDADFRLGFNALQMTVGAIAELTDAEITE